MCLTINSTLTKQHSLIKHNPTFIFYKDFEIRHDYTNFYLVSYFQITPIKNNSKTIEPKKFSIEINNDQIEGGVLHAYTSKSNSHCESFNPFEICIPILVKSNDIIAFGKYGDVCFSKYTISKSTWQTIHKKFKSLKQL